MDSYSSRANTVFASFVSILAVTAWANWMTSTWLNPDRATDVSASVEALRVHSFIPNNALRQDQALVDLAIDADLRKEFHWNTNQLFVYVTARYNGPKRTHLRNEVQLWDDIIQTPEEALIKLPSVQAEYFLRDPSQGELRGKEMQLWFNYRRMPIVGQMETVSLAMGNFTMPQDYTERPAAAATGSARRPSKKKRRGEATQ